MHAACDDLINVKHAKAVKALEKQNRASSVTATLPAAVDKSLLPQIVRTHIPSAERQTETMADDAGKERQSRRKNQHYPDPIQDPQRAKPQYHPLGDNSRPSHPQQPNHGGSGAIHGPQPSGFGPAPPGSGDHGATLLPQMQSSHYSNCPPTAMSSFLQNPGTHLNAQPGPTVGPVGGYVQPTPSKSKSVSKSSGPVPSMVKPRQGPTLQ